MPIFIDPFERAITADQEVGGRGFFLGRKIAVGDLKKPRRR
jgi:hypothetical protein